MWILKNSIFKVPLFSHTLALKYLTSLPSKQIKIKDKLKELVQICFIKRMANVDTFLMFNPLFSLYCFVDHCLFSSFGHCIVRPFVLYLWPLYCQTFCSLPLAIVLSDLLFSTFGHCIVRLLFSTFGHCIVRPFVLYLWPLYCQTFCSLPLAIVLSDLFTIYPFDIFNFFLASLPYQAMKVSGNIWSYKLCVSIL
jgi:hypothetical protein